MGLTDNPVYNGDPISDAQHQYMAENYVTPIAQAIRQIDGNRYSLDFYMWYGWKGLESTYDFKHKLNTNQKSDYVQKQQQINISTNVTCE
ncbi:hypothetical protein [Zhouia amylolytica]|uniref:hypothetical protein n=1 Tax=Zhouia amylolytica TaxID=376730 RepID=UPI0020CE562E|nr:hypothetical protein [Zhouia amylolytica]MCQ0112467.1 hypothetical protein [Zhouia amylolytica]